MTEPAKGRGRIEAGTPAATPVTTPRSPSSPIVIDRRNAYLLTVEDPFGLEDRHAAWLAGVDYGLVEGFRRGYAARKQELRSAAAGRVTSMLANVPEPDPRLAAAREAERKRRGWS